MAEKYVTLTCSANPVQHALLEDVLKEERIPFQVRERSGSTVILGSASPLGVMEFLVPEEMLQAAKETLCGNGIVCEVSGRLLHRSFEEIVKPLLAEPRARDFERLAYFVGINNKETVRALFEATLEEEGGLGLLEDLFFVLAGKDTSALRVLARALSPSMKDEFGARLLSGYSSLEDESREQVIDVLPELPDAPWRFDALLAGLRDEDSSVRAAASESLYTLEHGRDHGYDPDAPLEERESAIARLIG